MTFTVESEQEDDGRGIAEVIESPGVLADRLDQGEGTADRA